MTSRISDSSRAQNDIPRVKAIRAIYNAIALGQIPNSTVIPAKVGIHNPMNYTTKNARPLIPLPLLLTAVIVLLAACTQSAAPGSEPVQLGGPAVSAILVNSDLAVGPNRVAFGLVDRDNMPIRTPQAQVETVFFPPGVDQGEVVETVTAEFREWPPPGSRGVYVATLNFDRPGEGTQAVPALWGLQITATDADGNEITAKTVAPVSAESSTPGIGQPAPRSVTPTVPANGDLSTISSAADPDPDLYRLSVHEALDENKPLVVTFSTPAFCVSATCGPQLDVIARLKDKYRDRANFIHVEVVQDPHLVKDGRPESRWVPAVAEWGMETEPWTFIVDHQGLVQVKFEQFTPIEDIEAELVNALNAAAP